MKAVACVVLLGVIVRGQPIIGPTTQTTAGLVPADISMFLVGAVILIGAMWSLVVNERKALTGFKVFGLARSEHVKANPDRFDSDNEGKLVHMIAATSSRERDGLLRDKELGFAIPNCAKYRRKVEVFQSVAQNGTESKRGGQYLAHHASWVEAKPGSGSCSKLTSVELKHDVVCFGESFLLSPKQVDEIDWFVSRPAHHEDMQSLSAEYKDLRVESRWYYRSRGNGTLTHPEIGDIRISLEIVPHDYVSIMARQTGNTFQSWTAGEAAGDMESAPLLGSKDKESESVMWLDEGSVSAEVMIGRRSTENPRRTWTVRVASAALVVLGLSVFLWPAMAAASSTAFLRHFVGGGPAVPGLVCGTLLVVALIALVWVRQMPRRAGPTLAGVALFVLLGAVL